MEKEGSAATRVYIQEKQDSDQSFSEEEDMDDKWLTNDDCLSGPSGNKGRIGVLSQLEMLTDVKRLHHATDKMNSHQLQRQTDLCKDEDDEVPFFKSQNGDFINKNDHWMTLSLDDEFCHVTRMTSTCNSEEEIISDDEQMGPSTDGNLKRDGKSTMPKVSADLKSGVCLNREAGCSSLYGVSSNLNRSYKGSRGKAKPKFLFQSRPQKKDFALVVHESCETSTPLSVLPLNVELDMQRKNMESLDDLLENFGENEIQHFEESLVPSEVAVVPDPNEHSMAEFLDHFQHTSSLPRGNSKMKISQIQKSAIPQRSMADQFHLALGAVPTNERLSIARPKQFGLSGRLQHVMQCEKDRDTYFLEKLQTHDASSGAESFIDVRILSSSFEAKLSVCFCALHGDEEGSECLSNPQKRKGTGGRKLTIIFSSRVCKDVELEIGNVIRIHQPWKEVHVNEKDEAIILCAYFSQI
ncbi:uncharacterized protein LOC132610692 isoform X7 [Lycium barbarum]|uniref:uncharacterized protein LOC132610692 isoform X7 n=1 Tax=Lycium barbarum TaxID=112863 RepID=UPI00293E50EB|nr:uncharacterized protein LOC132610692 isoform X7 [Lycium barbarum]